LICIEFHAVMKWPKCTQTLWNTPEHEFRIQRYGSGAYVAKNSDATSLHELLHFFATVGSDLHRVLCNNEIVQMHPKHYETHKNMSLGSNGMDRVPSLRKIPTRLHCTNFCINCTISTWFAPKHYETQQNMSLGSNGMDRVPSLRKILTRLHCTNFCINGTSSPWFAPSFMQ